MLHNETVNIWTHLGGALILILLILISLFRVGPFGGHLDKDQQLIGFNLHTQTTLILLFRKATTAQHQIYSRKN